MLIFLTANVLFGFVFRSEGQIHIPVNKIIYEDTYLIGNSVQIDGTIHGDVFVLAKKLIITGTIIGDVNAVGGQLELKQKSVDTLRLLGKNIINSGTVQSDLFAAGETIELLKEDQIKKNISIAANQVILAGKIDGDANIKTAQLLVKPTSKIKGDLVYGAHKSDISSLAIVLGSTKVLEKEFVNMANRKAPWLQVITNKIVGNLYSIIVLFLFGIIFIKFLPSQTSVIIKEILEQPFRSLGIGVFVCLGTPLLALLLAFTVIGIPFAFIIFSFFGLGLYLSKIFITIILGKFAIHLLLKKDLLDTEKNLIREMVIGLIVYFILAKIPILGFFFAALATLISFGAFMSTRKRMYELGVKKGVF